MADFGIAEYALITAAVAATAQTGISINQAQQQRTSAHKARDSAKEAAAIQQAQLSAQAEQAKKNEQRKSAQIQGRIRALSAEAGVGTEGAADLLRQANYDETSAIATINQNETLQKKRIDTGLQADLTQIDSATPNLLLSSFAGILSGVQTGVQLVTAGAQVDNYFNKPVVPTGGDLPFAGRAGVDPVSDIPFANRYVDPGTTR